MLDGGDILEFDAHGMANASIIGRSERTSSLGYTKDRKRFTDFGASAKRADGKPDGGDVLELRVRVNETQFGMSKPETLRQIAQQLIDEATQALESSAHSGEQPPPWIRAFMSLAGWERYHQLCSEAGRAILEPASHTGGGELVFLPTTMIPRLTRRTPIRGSASEENRHKPCLLRRIIHTKR